MFYYEVLVGDMQFHGKEALTYSSVEAILPGTVVRIALRDRSPLGIVDKKVAKPAFTVKPIAAIAPYPPVPSEYRTLITWMSSYYPAPLGTVVRQFLPPTTAFPKLKSNAHENTSTAFVPPAGSPLPPLTPAQDTAVARLAHEGYHILHGVTGSGKTRIYLELAHQTVQSGRSALILTPEIGLTAQLTQAFAALFPGKVYVLHSRLTAAERRDIWYRILSAAQPVVVIGPRSALFAPVRSIGLIVIDESHDQAYKNETAPHYRTDMVAAQLARLYNATLICGSATPTLDAYYVAQAKKRPVIELHERALQSLGRTTDPANVIMVDLRDKALRGSNPIFSLPLQKAIKTALERHEQSLLFLNKRGTASAILCQDCGWRLSCTHCDLPLTYHGDTHSVRCHTCGRTSPLPQECPECSSTNVILKSYGTKAVVEEASRLFPSAKIQRFDTDTAKDESIENVLSMLKTGSADIIVGTQMITKGFDLPQLSVVGILNADSSLLIPDYSATERTFQLVSQVAGRVGRGHRDGTVIIQTYNPDNPTLIAAINQDWDTFYKAELLERKNYLFPPFVFLLRLTCLRASSKTAEKAAHNVKDNLLAMYGKSIRVEGPSPAFHPREQKKYKWQLVVKSQSRTVLTNVIRDLPANWRYDIDPINLL